MGLHVKCELNRERILQELLNGKSIDCTRGWKECSLEERVPGVGRGEEIVSPLRGFLRTNGKGIYKIAKWYRYKVNSTIRCRWIGYAPMPSRYTRYTEEKKFRISRTSQNEFFMLTDSSRNENNVWPKERRRKNAGVMILKRMYKSGIVSLNKRGQKESSAPKAQSLGLWSVDLNLRLRVKNVRKTFSSDTKRGWKMSDRVGYSNTIRCATPRNA